MIRDIELMPLPPLKPDDSGDVFFQTFTPTDRRGIKKISNTNQITPTPKQESLSKSSADSVICYLAQDINSKNWYFLFGEDEEDINELKQTSNNYNVYSLSYEHYKTLLDNQFVVHPNIAETASIDTKLSFINDSLWQTACGFLASMVIDNNAWNVGTQLGLPAGLGLLAGALRGYVAYRNYKKEFHESPPPAVRNEIIKDCAFFAAKTTIGMGAWELGYFVGQTLALALGATPVSFWVPIAFVIGSGLFQGISAVISEVMDEKRKYGEVRSSAFDLTKVFLTNFVNGTVSAVCGFIPFGSVIVSALLKPLVADIITPLIAGAATAVISYTIDKLVPKLTDKAALAIDKTIQFFTHQFATNKQIVAKLSSNKLSLTSFRDRFFKEASKENSKKSTEQEPKHPKPTKK